MNSTIVAISTPPGAGSQAVLRVSGPGTRKLIEHHQHSDSPFQPEAFGQSHVLFSLGETTRPLPTRVVSFLAPRSYTGEDLVEIAVPGSPALLGVLLRRFLSQTPLGSFDIEPAQAGEFTLRAFRNGKIDLDQAEAVGRLIHASGEAEAKAAYRQISGALGQKLQEIESPILEALALIEVGLDFPDEELPEIDPRLVIEPLKRAQVALKELSEHAKLRLPDRGTLRIVLLGLPNAGKSSLLNALVDRPAALVSPIEGTTIDPVRAYSRWKDRQLEWVDLAGLEGATWKIQGMDPDFKPQEFAFTPGTFEGQLEALKAISRLGEKELESADLILWISPLGETHPAEEEEITKLQQRFSGRWVRIISKADLLSVSQKEAFQADSNYLAVVSAQTGEGLESLLNRVLEFFDRRMDQHGFDYSEETFLLSPFQQVQLQFAVQALDQALELIEIGMGRELMAVDLREALASLAPLTGKEVSERVLGTIFGQFCIGK